MKKFRISGVVKIVCVILSILFMGAAAGLAFNVGRAAFFYNDALVAVDSECLKENSYTKTYMFNQELAWDVESLSIVVQHDLSVLLSQSLEGQREATIKELTQQYLLEKAKIIEAELFYVANNWEDNGDTYYSNQAYTLPETQVRNVVEVDPDAPRIVRDVQTILNGTQSGMGYLDYEMLVREDAFQEASFYAEKSIETQGQRYVFSSSSEEFDIDYTYNEHEIRDVLSDQYSYFIASETDEETYYDASKNVESFKSVKYYVENSSTGKVLTNLTGHALEQIMLSPIQIKLENGECSYKGISDETMMRYGIIDCFDNFSDEYSVYLSVVPTEGDIYHTIKEYDESMKNSNFPIQSVLAVILCIASIALAVTVPVCSGKSAWIDRLPIDIHLVLTGALGTSAVMGAMGVYWLLDNSETLVYSPLACGVASLVAFICWALLLEFFCSLVRVCKGNKPFWKSCLIFRIIHWMYIKFSALAKKLFKVFAYKPRIMKKQFAVAVLLYVAVSGALNFFFALMFLYNEEFLGILFFAAFVVLTLACAYKLLNYVASLDRVITAVKEREEMPKEDLPSSLQILADSMEYTNEELRLAVEKAVKDERLRTELITNVSHDLKTPLTSIVAYVDLLSGCDLQDSKAEEYIGVLEEKSASLKRLIDDLLEASKSASGVVSLNITPINLSELVVQAVGENEQDFENASLDLILKTADDVTVVSDGNKTYRIMENLLSNAKKYSAKGSRVYASVYKLDNFGVFEIKNISQEPLDISPEELTERFVRGDKSRNEEGNGLGLSIAKNLAVIMGGTLDIIIDGDLFKVSLKLPLSK